MEARRLTFEYDSVGDILRIQTRPPYAEQDSDEVGDLVVARRNPDSGAIESLEIIGFRRRTDAGERFDLPILAQFQLSDAA